MSAPTRTGEPPVEGGGARRAPVTRPRPGHADLAGAAKYGRSDVRDVLERASARETAARVAAGAIAKQLLARAGASITSHVFVLGEAALPAGTVVSFEQAAALPDDSPLRCVDADVERQMIAGIDRAQRRPATRWAARSKSSSGASPSGSAATSSGTASSTAVWRRR